MTAKVSRSYEAVLREKKSEVQVLSLSDLPPDFLFSETFGRRSDAMVELIEKFILKADKLVFVIPEYNGSYPGILKGFFDAISSRAFRGKKAGIIGVSDGHAGNLRGQDHLTGVLHYMRVLVHPIQPKLSAINLAFDDNDNLKDERAIRLLSEHAEAMIHF